MLVGMHKDSFKGYTPFMQRFESILAYNDHSQKNES